MAHGQFPFQWWNSNSGEASSAASAGALPLSGTRDSLRWGERSYQTAHRMRAWRGPFALTQQVTLVVQEVARRSHRSRYPTALALQCNTSPALVLLFFCHPRSVNAYGETINAAPPRPAPAQHPTSSDRREGNLSGHRASSSPKYRPRRNEKWVQEFVFFRGGLTFLVVRRRMPGSGG
jgi:hypothetical protein